jgi:hypothetical protein
MQLGWSLGFSEVAHLLAPASIVVQHFHKDDTILADGIELVDEFDRVDIQQIDRNEPLQQDLLSLIASFRNLYFEDLSGWFTTFVGIELLGLESQGSFLLNDLLVNGVDISQQLLPVLASGGFGGRGLDDRRFLKFSRLLLLRSVERWFFIHFRNGLATLDIVFLFVFVDQVGINHHNLSQRFFLFAVSLLRVVCISLFAFLWWHLTGSMNLGFEDFEGSFTHNFLLRVVFLEAVIQDLLLLVERSYKVQVIQFVLLLSGRTHILVGLLRAWGKGLVVVEDPLDQLRHGVFVF